MPDSTDPVAPIPPCPRCQATHVVRNGHNPAGSAHFLCRGCGRQFVARPRKGPVPDATRGLIRRLLRERMSLRGIARATGVSRSGLQGLVNARYRDPTPLEPGPRKTSRAT